MSPRGVLFIVAGIASEPSREVAVKNHWMAIIILSSLMGVLAGCTAAPAKEADDIPAPLQVAANEVLVQRAHAAGVQIYRCSPDKSDAARFGWQLQAPEADLLDHAGHKIGKHYAGPTWEARDGSKVLGEVAARAPSPDPNAVAWLLLSAKSTSGAGVFARVRFIQRLHTVGGNPPAGGCDQVSAGGEVRVPYSAEYRFYVDKP
jgi:hypothetical protein